MVKRYKVRPTGIAAAQFGLQWEVIPSDAEIARRVIRFLEDRRMLWGLEARESPDHVLQSAIQIRQYLTDEISTFGIGDDLESLLRQMRMLFTHFMSTPADDGFGLQPPHNTEFMMALGALRASVGERIAALASTYDVDIDENLKRIVPETAAWFFDQFAN